MDKVKQIVAFLVKYNFWVVCSVVLIASLVSWFLAASKLDAEKAAQEAVINSTFTAMTTVSSMPDHPNPVVTSKLQAVGVTVADNVYDAWLLRYKEQQKVPQWQGDLSKPFLDWINSHGPDEAIPGRFREEYRNFIKAEIELLIEQANVRELVEIENPALLAPPKAGQSLVQRNNALNQEPLYIQEWRGLVDWDLAQREALLQQYNWSLMTPTSLQVRFANEDLWIYRALLEIIAKTNLQADGKTPIKEHVLANIKKIEGLHLGRNVPPPKTIFVPTAVPGAAVVEAYEAVEDLSQIDPSMYAGGGGDLGIIALGVAGDANMTPQQMKDAEIKHGRYVDADGKPLAYNASDPFPQFKIMPFYMGFIMDQRKIPDLLAHCANSPLPVEVQQVDINSTEAPGSAIGTGADDSLLARVRAAGGGGDAGGLLAQAQMMGGYSSVAGATDIGAAVEMRPIDLHVEIRGVIYIFNKPERSAIGKSAAPAEAPAEPAAPPAAG